MRISHQMLHQNSMNHVSQNMSRLNKAYNDASTGKQIHKPSDDPHGVSQAMQLKSAISANGQYERNTSEANLVLDETDQTINSMVNVMHRVRELSVQGNNGTLNDEDRNIIATEVEELTEQLRQFANTQVNGNYLFNGTNTKNPPYVNKNSHETADFTDVKLKTFTIADGLTLEVGVKAGDLFGEGEAGLFAKLTEAAENLRAGEKVSLDNIDAGVDQMLQKSAEVGARKNRVEAVENRISGSTLELKQMLSKIEDIDIAEAITKLKSEESLYQASLAASAKIIQPSLMDFLR